MLWWATAQDGGSTKEKQVYDDFEFSTSTNIEASHPLTAEEVLEQIRIHKAEEDPIVGQILTLFVEVWWFRESDNLDEGISWYVAKDGSVSFSSDYRRHDSPFYAEIGEGLDGLNALYSAMVEDERYYDVTIEFLFYPS